MFLGQKTMSKIVLKTMHFLDKRKKFLGRANKFGKICITLQKAVHELNQTVYPVFGNRHLDL